MKSSIVSSKDNEVPTVDGHTRGIVYPPEAYPPPPHYGSGPPPPPGYAPLPMPGYGGHPLPQPPPYGVFPLSYNSGPYAPPPQAYSYPHHPPPPPAYCYGPPPPATNASTKKKKSGMSKILGMGAGLVGGVVGGLLLGELTADGGATTPSFDLFSDPTGGGGIDYDARIQSMSDSMDLLNSIG